MQAPAKDEEPITFEGVPLVLGKSVYIVQSSVRGLLVLASLCCFNAETGALRWEQDLVEAPEFGSSAAPRYQHESCGHHTETDKADCQGYDYRNVFHSINPDGRTPGVQ